MKYNIWNSFPTIVISLQSNLHHEMVKGGWTWIQSKPAAPTPNKNNNKNKVCQTENPHKFYPLFISAENVRSYHQKVQKISRGKVTFWFCLFSFRYMLKIQMTKFSYQYINTHNLYNTFISCQDPEIFQLPPHCNVRVIWWRQRNVIRIGVKETSTRGKVYDAPSHS